MPSVSVNKPINGPGWYLISSSTPLQQGEELKSFYEVIHNLKADSAAEINIFKAAFYYPYAFSPDDSFTSADWNRVEDINEYYIPDGTQDGSRSYLYRMSPNLGYWVKIESYSPKIILVGDGETSQLTNVIAELYTVFTPPTATSSGGESVTVDVTNIPVDSNNNTVNSLGTYTIIYSVVNSVGDISTRELSVTVTDPSPPVITILNPTIYLNTTDSAYTNEFNVKDLLIDNSYISVSDSSTATENIIVVTSPQTLTDPLGSVQVDISANDGFSTVDASIVLVFMGNPAINPVSYSTNPTNGYLGIDSSNQIVKLNGSSDIVASNLVSVETGVNVVADPANINDSTEFVTYNATHVASGFTSDASYDIIHVDAPNIDIKALGNYANFVYGPSNDTIYIQADKGVSAAGELFVDVSDNVTLTLDPILLTASNESYLVNYVATDQYGFTSDASLSIVTVPVPALTPSSELIYPDNSLTINYTKPYWLNDSNETTLMAPIFDVSNINALTYVNALSDYTIDVSSTVVTDTSFADLSSVSDPSYSVITYTLTQNTYGFETDISYNVTIRTDIAPPIITGPDSFTLLDPTP